MDLIAAGIIVFILLLASYSTRKTWIALGSMAVSITLLIGALLLFTAQDAEKIHSGFATLAKKLPDGWEQPLFHLTAAIGQASTAVANAIKTRAEKLGPVQETLQATLTSDWFGATSDVQIAAPDKPEAEPTAEPEPEPSATIAWRLQPADGEILQLGGTNVSGHALEKVRAILKPDSDTEKLELILQIEGQTAGATTIPPGASFDLVAPALTGDEAAEFGGAILSLGYVQQGQRKKAIMYLTPPMLGRVATRE